jgi:hypothetical protein
MNNIFTEGTESLDIVQVFRRTKNSLLKLEGVAEGLKPFHPRMGAYIEANINEIRRSIYAYENPLGLVEAWEKASFKSKPGYEEIDREVEEEYKEFVKNKITDRKVIEELEDDEEEEE